MEMVSWRLWTQRRMGIHRNMKANDFVSYRLTVEYTVDGQTYTVRNQRYVDGYGVGDPVEVIYDPADPSISQVDFFQERWFDPLVEMLPF